MKSKEEIYAKGIEILREHAEETCFRVMKGRNENKGNFAYIQDVDFKREARLAKMLKFLLWRLKLEIDGKTDMEGLCGAMCIDCSYKGYNFHSKRTSDHWCNESEEGWVCQEECECK